MRKEMGDTMGLDLKAVEKVYDYLDPVTKVLAARYPFSFYYSVSLKSDTFDVEEDDGISSIANKVFYELSHLNISGADRRAVLYMDALNNGEIVGDGFAKYFETPEVVRHMSKLFCDAYDLAKKTNTRDNSRKPFLSVVK